MTSLRRRLITIIVAAILPLVILASIVVVIVADRRRESVETMARTQVHRIVELLDRELYNHITTLRALATSSALDHGDLASFYEQAGRVRVAEPHWATVTLADPDSGRLLLDLRQPLGSALGDVVDLASFAAVKDTMRPAIGDVVDPATTAGPSLVRVRVPVIRAGALRYVLTVGLDRGELQNLLATAKLPGEWTTVVADRAGLILARVPYEPSRIGRRVNPAAAEPVAAAPVGAYRGVGPLAGPFLAVYETSALSGWSVHAGVPEREFDATEARAVWLAIAGGVGSLALLVTLFALVFREIANYRRSEEALRRSQKLEAIGHLTGGVAHDFNNLLMVIIGNVGTLKEGLTDLDAASLRAIEATMRAAQRGATLTQRLLAFSRQQPLSPRPVDINRLVAGMSEVLRRTLGETIAVEAVLAGGLWSVHVDAGELESALLNLALNARDAMPGGGKLTIETANAHLDEAYARAHEELKSGQYVQLAVTDTGTGMPPAVAARAFDPFFTTKEVGAGTGLGLSQVYGFVKQSGGHVKIYSEEGQGTTVKVYLPRQRGAEEVAEEGTAEPAPVARREGERVLVVEDDADVRRFVVGELQRLGYRVSDAASGMAALEILEREPLPDLMLTDVGLPGSLNGRQLSDEARRRHPGLKVLYTTGYARNAIVHQGKLDHGVELIVKPFDRAALATKVRTVLDAG